MEGKLIDSIKDNIEENVARLLLLVQTDYSLSSFKQKLSDGNQEKSKVQERIIKNSLLTGKCSIEKFVIIILAPSLFLCKS